VTVKPFQVASGIGGLAGRADSYREISKPHARVGEAVHPWVASRFLVVVAPSWWFRHE